jgi:hypothetical protein
MGSTIFCPPIWNWFMSNNTTIYSDFRGNYLKTQKFSDKIKIEYFLKKVSSTHYQFTSYSFEPKLAKKIVIQDSIEIEGILEYLKENK